MWFRFLCACRVLHIFSRKEGPSFEYAKAKDAFVGIRSRGSRGALGGVFAQAQMDDVTMPGGEKKAPPAVLTESEFKEWAAKPGAVVFDLQYKGLTDKEINQANSFWGYGSRSEETPFIKSVGLAKDKCLQFHLPLLRGSDEGLLEYEGKDVKALYLDLDCDGKLGKGEKIKPIEKKNGSEKAFYFVTPDFTATWPTARKCLSASWP
jgi:hypothetical protein